MAMSSMKKFTAPLAFIFAMVLVAGLGSTPAQALTSIGLNDIYSVDKITQVYLEIPPLSEASLNTNQTLKTYVPAKVKFVQGGLSSDQVSIGIRLKGTTSLMPLSQKPSMKLRFNWSTALKGQRFLGLKNMTLNSLSQDESWIHEIGAYKLYNTMGVAAPRTGWAEVFVNGKSKGIYVDVETPDDIFLASRFKDATQHLYEGVAQKDLLPGSDNGDESTGNFTVDEGWKAAPNKKDLGALIAVASGKSGKAWWDGLAKVMDRDSMLKMFAVDNIIGSWDSYSGPIINNYYLRSNSKGLFTFVPWGPDNTFGEDRASKQPLDSYTFAMDAPAVGFPWIKILNWGNTMKRGVLFTKCLAYKPCLTSYISALKATSAKVTSTKLGNFMTSAGAVVANYSSDGVKAEQARSVQFLQAQQKVVASLVKKYQIR
jgi:spore coat protein CotH